MAKSVQIVLYRDSLVEDVLEMKCCSMNGMNLEVTARNSGDERVRLQSMVLLEGPHGKEMIDYLFPHGVQTIEPGEALAFYCSYDCGRLKLFNRVTAFEEDGTEYSSPIAG